MARKTGTDRLVRTYSADGESYGNEIVSDVRFVRFQFGAAGDTLVCDLSDLEGFNDLLFGVARQAVAFGINTAVGNAANTNPADSELTAFEAAEARWSRIAEDGEWASAGRGGPRTAEFVEAVRRTREELGMPADAEWAAGYTVKLRGMGDEERTKHMDALRSKYGQIAAHQAAIRSEAAERRAAALRAKAGDAQPEDTGDLAAL